MFDLLNESLKRLEQTIKENTPEFGAYSEAMAFLDSIYFISRVLFDVTAGVVRHYYKINEKCELPKSFSDMHKKSKEGKLPKNLNEVFLGCDKWFPHLKKSRDEIVHHYETYLIGVDENVAVLFSPRNKENEISTKDLYSYLGSFMSGYQLFIDALLDHFDTKIFSWYGIVRSIETRKSTILEGRRSNMLFWAYQYGGYRNDNLIIYE